MHSIPLAEDDVTPALADPALDLSADLRGTLVAGGRHELAELFFHGEQGSVYLGRDTHSNRPVEVKILASEAATTAAVDRFRERSRRMLGLSHPGIAAVLGEGITENGLPFVVMEHRAGRNLHHLQGDPRLAWPAPAAVVRQLAEALAALHALGVVHGAVTPGNIVWIDDAGTSPRVQLVDREFDLPPTHEFAAFEARGSFGPQSDTRSTPGDAPPGDDLHALGAVVYELCTGRAPEPPGGEPGLRSMHREDAQVAVPERFEAVVLALLDPASRPASAMALLDLLDRATSGMQAGDLDFLAALGEDEPTRFGAADSARFAPSDSARFTPTSSSRFVVRVEPHDPASLDSSSAAHALAAAMDAFDSDEPPEKLRVPIPEPRPVSLSASGKQIPFAAPAVAEPAVAEPAVAEPAVAEPAVAEPAATDPLTTSAEPDRHAAEPSASASIPLISSGEHALSSGEHSHPPAVASASDPRLHTATPSGPPPEPTTATLAARSEPPTLAARVEASPGGLALPRDRTRLIVVLAVGLLLILLAWLLRAPAEPLPDAEPVPPQPSISEARTGSPLPEAPRTGSPLPDPERSAPADATLASGAAPPLPSEPEAPPAEPAPTEPAEPDTRLADAPQLEQLSAGEFRRLMLRSNRTEAARDCYRKHARPGEEEISVIALVNPAGRIQKPRISPEVPLAGCLRKLIAKLEFPPAARPAQHNFVYRHPDAL